MGKSPYPKRQLLSSKISLDKDINKLLNNVMQNVALIFYGIAVIDFITSWLGINLTYFLGEASRFSPLIFGGIGLVISKMAETGGAEDDSDVPEKYKTKPAKKTKRKK